MDLRQIFNLVKRWLWLLILGTVVAGGFGYYTSSRETPLYQASTRFVILRAATTTFDYYAYIDHQQLVSTYTQLLSTDALLDQVSQELGFRVFAGQANAAQIGDTQFVRLTVTHPEPEKAAAIANVLVNALIEQNDQLQSVRFETTERNLQTRADNALIQIELLQNQIDQITNTIVEDQLAQVEAQLDQLQSEVTELELRIANINPELPVERQTALRLEIEAELGQIRPILALYQQLYTELIVMGEPIRRGDTTLRQVAQIQRTLDIYQQIYFSSISSLEALNLTRVQSVPNVVQVEPASVPRAPISPRPLQTTGLYAAVGLLGSAGIAFLVEYLDDTLKTPDDVKDALGLPVIGFVADIKDNGFKKSGAKRGIFVADQPRSPISEAFRAMRTSLEFYSVDRPLRSLIITSSGPQEGKTTIASNLAISLAQSNKQVLLMDADMRRPSLHTQLNVSNRLGLSDLMRGRMSPLNVVQVSEQIENLFVITSGSLPPNPAELLASDRMAAIIEELKETYDFVVIDSPPTIVTDAQILSTKADGVLYVIQPGKTRLVQVKTPLEEFERIGANLIGVILNRIPRNREFYYGGYDYYAPKSDTHQYYRNEGESMLGQSTAEADQKN